MECRTFADEAEAITTWFDDELIVRQLHHNDFPFNLPPEPSPIPADEMSHSQILQSTLRSLPTVQETQEAQWMNQPPEAVSDSVSVFVSPPRVSLCERGINRIDSNKYTVKLKWCENGMADDGYKWRKYGQKSIKNSPYPRSYYKCTNPRCSAKKQVERSREEEDTIIITYEGLHLHFTYPFFPPSSIGAGDNPPPPKRPRTTFPGTELAEQFRKGKEEPPPGTESPSYVPTDANGGESDRLLLMRAAPQGLLEDLVPFVVRNPAPSLSLSSSSVGDGVNNNSLCSNSSNSCSSYRSSSVASSPSSLTWSPESLSFR